MGLRCVAFVVCAGGARVIDCCVRTSGRARMGISIKMWIRIDVRVVRPSLFVTLAIVVSVRCGRCATNARLI